MMAAKDSAHAAAYEEDRSLRNAAGESEDEVDFEDRVAQLKNSGGFDKVGAFFLSFPALLFKLFLFFATICIGVSWREK